MSTIPVHSISVNYDGLTRVIFSPVSLFNLVDGKRIETKAIWDTGATGSALTKSAVDKLGLSPIGLAKVKGVHGEKTVNTYFLKVVLNNDRVSFNLKVTECDSLAENNEAEMLIGMDIIGKGDFVVTNFDNKTTMSYRTPSVQKLDFVESSKQSHPLIKTGPPTRNSPCPCGSGKKYKHCHGKK